MFFEFSSVKRSQGSSFSKQLVLKVIIFIVHGLISMERWFVNIMQKAKRIKRIKKTAKSKKKLVCFFLHTIIYVFLLIAGSKMMI